MSLSFLSRSSHIGYARCFLQSQSSIVVFVVIVIVVIVINVVVIVVIDDVVVFVVGVVPLMSITSG